MYKEIYISELASIDGKQIIDVREIDEFEDGHIPSAKNLPLSSFVSTYQEIDADKEVYVVCHLGGRSARAAQFLAQEGYNVTNLAGGMEAWNGEVE